MNPAVSAYAYDAARRRAAFIDRSDRGRIVVSGGDRASYLQGLLTNDVVALAAGQGSYAAYLTAQGRMIADAYVYELGDVMLLTMAGDVKDTVMAKLDQFIFGEDVQLGDVTAAFAQIAVVGPTAADAVAAALESEGARAFSASAREQPERATVDAPKRFQREGGQASGATSAELRSLPEHGNLRTQWAGGAAIVTRITDAGEPGFDAYVERQHVGALKSALASADVPELDDTTAEALRIETGVPLFHRDMDEDTIPLEAGIESRAISFTKGCYVGQEVVIRVLHRGHGRVARKLVGLALEGSRVPASGAAIRAGDKEVGHVTSSTMSPALQKPIALGYVHRDFVEPGTNVSVDGTSGQVVALPFVSGGSAFRPSRGS